MNLGEIASTNGDSNGEHDSPEPPAEPGTATLPDPKAHAEAGVEAERQRGDTKPATKPKRRQRQSHNPQHAKLIADIEKLRKGAVDQVKRLDAALKELRMKGTN